MKVTAQIVNYLFKVVEESGSAALGGLPMRLCCVDCGAAMWLNRLWHNGAQKVTCPTYACPVTYQWPEESQQVLSTVKLEPTVPLSHVTVLEWDYTTNPASSHFVQKLSGPEFDAEVQRHRARAWAEFQKETRA